MEKQAPDRKTRLSRRAFLGSGVGAAAVLKTGTGKAQDEVPTPSEVAPPSAAQLERDAGASQPPQAAERAVARPGSDLMVQVLKDLGVEYVAANPASSFEGLQESIVNYGSPPNTRPELVTALHEESAVDMAAGYAKAEGVPMAVMLHGTIGTQHASMAIYQAYQSQTPILILIGRDDSFFRQEQTANDIAGLVRPYTKWDALPTTLEDCLLAIQQAYNEAITPPRGPSIVVVDAELQYQEAGTLGVPDYRPPTYPTISEQEAQNIAASLMQAQNPHLRVGRLRTPQGIAAAIELAELVAASVTTRATQGPMSFPQSHPLTGPGANTDYDFVLGLEAPGRDTAINSPGLRSASDSRDTTGIGFGFVRREPDIRPRGTPPPGRNELIADAQASLALVIAAVRNELSPGGQAVIAERSRQHAIANRENRAIELRAALEARRSGWTSSPVNLARLYAELWPHIREEDWCLSSPTIFSGRHHAALWDHDKPYSYLGVHGAGGIGYGIGASAGAALAAKHRDRFVVNVQCDGDLNYAPGSLWTAAHHELPLLSIMHNNRGYHQEVMYLHYMAGVRGRGTDRMHIGTTLRSPDISYRSLADAYGVEAEGPISDPDMLADAFARGVAAVKSGRPYLIDVLTQPR